MATRIVRPATAFEATSGKKRPREHNERHLDFIRSLPCVRCMAAGPNHAAHVRFASAFFNKPLTGAGIKPDDKWTVPLCAEHHLFGPDAQHDSNERQWWNDAGIHPLLIALLLFAVSGDFAAGSRIIYYSQAITMGGIGKLA